MAGENIQSPAGATTVAVTDIGTNAIRMVIAQVLEDGHVEVLERAQRAVRLGQDTFVSGRLSNEAMSAAISILGDFRRILETYQVRQVRAVATSAVREAMNAEAFVERVFMTCGLDVEVIDPAEESRLTVSAVRQAIGHDPIVDRHDALIADVGGGSALLTVLHKGQLAGSESFRLGSIRLQETLSTANEPPRRAAQLIRHQISGLLGMIAGSLELARLRTFIAVGGDARFAAGQIGRSARSANLTTIATGAFDELVADCERRTTEELAERYGLAHPDAETLMPALLVYQGLVHETSARAILVCEATMRDGLLLDLARSVTGQEDRSLADSVMQSARSIGEKYRYDAAHAENVSTLAVRLFDELRKEHGLNARHRLLLRVAGLLHEVGGYVSGRAHHKHSYYLLSNAEIFGLRREELEVVALAARYHRRSAPKPAHIEYMSRPRETRMVVSKLAALLRVADSLDRGHAGQIRDIEVVRGAGELVIRARGASDVTLERRALAQKAGMFEDIFGMRVRLEEAPPAPGRAQT